MIKLEDINICYQQLDFDKIKIEVLNHIKHHAKPKPSKVSWNNAWLDVYHNFSSDKIKFPKPNYFNCNIYRYNKNYIYTDTSNLEEIYSKNLIKIISQKYINNYDEIIELGCGCGRNLISFKEFLPEKIITGTDWTESPNMIIKEINKKFKYDILFQHFDMTGSKKLDNLCKTNNACVLTIGSMEQLNSNFKNILSLMLTSKKIKIFIHIEPIIELYDKSDFDMLAIKYHKKRQYLEGFLPELIDLHINGNIKISKIHKSNFGTTYNDGFSVIIWRNNEL